MQQNLFLLRRFRRTQKEQSHAKECGRHNKLLGIFKREIDSSILSPQDQRTRHSPISLYRTIVDATSGIYNMIKLYRTKKIFIAIRSRILSKLHFCTLVELFVVD